MVFDELLNAGGKGHLIAGIHADNVIAAGIYCTATIYASIGEFTPSQSTARFLTYFQQR